MKALPALSVANVRELLQATMPLPQLSPDQATYLVVKFPVNPSRVTRSRHKSQSKKRAQPNLTFGYEKPEIAFFTWLYIYEHGYTRE